MGILDHGKTWHFAVAASPDQCAAAFAAALRGKNMFSPRKGNWSVDYDTTDDGLPLLTATYEGRGGAMKAMTMMSGRATEVEEAAMRSTITFKVDGVDESQRTSCAMWLSSAAKKLGFTADAGFFRSYMNDVATQLRNLDDGLLLQKA